MHVSVSSTCQNANYSPLCARQHRHRRRLRCCLDARQSRVLARAAKRRFGTASGGGLGALCTRRFVRRSLPIGQYRRASRRAGRVGAVRVGRRAPTEHRKAGIATLERTRAPIGLRVGARLHLGVRAVAVRLAAFKLFAWTT